MVRIAFVNMGFYRGHASGKRSFVDPVHLLGMHHICERAGHDSIIFQYGDNTPQKSIDRVNGFKPDVLGFSFIGHDPESVKGAHRILKSFGGRKLQLLIGGPDVEFYPDHYQNELSPHFPSQS